jgi:Right handed beta helix region
MSLNKFWTRYFFFFVLPLLFIPCSQASTVTVVPSEAQSQIQASINNSHVGDTISFQAGTFSVNKLRLQPGRTYVGATHGQTVIHGSGGYSLFVFYGSGLTLQYFTFDGGGLYLGKGSANVKIEYNVFQNIPFGPNAQTEFGNWTTTVGVFIDTSATNLDISHNSFHNLHAQILNQFVDHNLGVTAIFGYGLSNATITYNTFDTLNEGIHLFSGPGGSNVHINNNTFTNFHRMAVEIQTNTHTLEVGYNTVTHPLYPFWLTFGLSVPFTGVNGNVHNNLVDDQIPKACSSTCWIGIAIEAAGTDSIIANNTIQGYWSNGVAIGTSHNLQVVNNSICGPNMNKPGAGYVDNEKGTTSSGEVISNNYVSTALVCAK